MSDTWKAVMSKHIDVVMATDVIYKGSPYDKLAELLEALARQHDPEILIIIPKQRDCRDDFLRIMSGAFQWTVTELTGKDYQMKALASEKESDKYYPGLMKLNFDLYSFKLRP